MPHAEVWLRLKARALDFQARRRRGLLAPLVVPEKHDVDVLQAESGCYLYGIHRSQRQWFELLGAVPRLTVELQQRDLLEHFLSSRHPALTLQAAGDPNDLDVRNFARHHAVDPDQERFQGSGLRFLHDELDQR